MVLFLKTLVGHVDRYVQALLVRGRLRMYEVYFCHVRAERHRFHPDQMAVSQQGWSHPPMFRVHSPFTTRQATTTVKVCVLRTVFFLFFVLFCLPALYPAALTHICSHPIPLLSPTGAQKKKKSGEGLGEGSIAVGRIAGSVRSAAAAIDDQGLRGVQVQKK